MAHIWSGLEKSPSEIERYQLNMAQLYCCGIWVVFSSFFLVQTVLGVCWDFSATAEWGSIKVCPRKNVFLVEMDALEWFS